MTVQLYLQNALLFSQEALIIGSGKDENGFFVHLDQSIFHPKGGGQPSDQGVIDRFSVKTVTQNGPILNHYIEEIGAETELLRGKKVSLHVNEAPRCQNTALHSGGHILAEIVEKMFPNLHPFKGHHFPNEAHVMFKVENKELLPPKEEMQNRIKEAVQKVIQEQVPIISVLQGEGKRTIQIGDGKIVGCGGTHFAHAGFLQDFTIRKLDFKKDELKASYNATPRPL
jgi:alanyl-tRNA synthetase